MFLFFWILKIKLYNKKDIIWMLVFDGIILLILFVIFYFIVKYCDLVND